MDGADFTPEMGMTMPPDEATPPPSQGGRSNEGSGGKRQVKQKTPFQKEALEAAFQLSKFPTEEQKRNLAERIDLTSEQVTVWFTHRRRKDRQQKEKEGASPGALSPGVAAAGGALAGAEGLPAPSPHRHSGSLGRQSPAYGMSASAGVSAEVSEVEGCGDNDHYAPESSYAVLSLEEYHELAGQAEALLPVPYRPDGPILGFDFDDPPGVKRPCAGGEMPPDAKRQKTQTKVAKDREKAQRMLEKDLNKLAKEREKEQMRLQREMAKQDREAKKASERAERERTRDEDRRRKELEKLGKEREKARKKLEAESEKARKAQEREMERERKRQEMEENRRRKAEEKEAKKEAKRREAEMKKELKRQERQTMKAMSKEDRRGPPDDSLIELQKLYKKLPPQQVRAMDPNSVELPPFPPPAVSMAPAFTPSELESPEDGLDLVMCWNFLQSYSDLLGMPHFSVEELLTALKAGTSSTLLGTIHILLLRLLQADMEESHAQAEKPSGPGAQSAQDKVAGLAASLLEETWAWGFEPDSWRAHLNALTWPEILRQYSIAAGLGPKRAKQKRQKTRGGFYTEYEDVLDDSNGLKLRMPARLGKATMKAACWMVLSKVGPEGMVIGEVAKRIKEEDLRDLRSSKTPEASVAGALGRDGIFRKVAPATYALTSVCIYSERNEADGTTSVAAGSGEVKAEGDGAEAGAAAAPEAAPEPEEVGGNESEEDEEEEEEQDVEQLARAGEAWVHALLQLPGYDGLSLRHRLAALAALVHLACEGPSVKARIEHNIEEVAKVKKAAQDDMRAEKRRRQQEASQRAAEEAARKMEEIRAKEAELLQQAAGAHVDPAAPASTSTPGASASMDTTPVGKSATPWTAPPSTPQMSPGQPEQENKFNGRDWARTIRRAEERHLIRAEPLGYDRRHNRYWRFKILAGEQDPCHSRLFFESSGHNGGDAALGEGKAALCQLDSQEALDELKDCLDVEGLRESMLAEALRSLEGGGDLHLPHYTNPLQPLTSLELVLDSEEEEQRHLAWLGKGCMSLVASALLRPAQVAMTQCCVDPAAAALEGLDSGAARMQAAQVCVVKQEMLSVVLALPEAALEPAFDRQGLWVPAVKAASDGLQLRGLLGQLEAAIKPEHLSSLHRRCPPVVLGAWHRIGGEVVSTVPVNHAGDLQEAFGPIHEEEPNKEPLAWMPATPAALSLRVRALDSSLHYAASEPPGRENLLPYKYVIRQLNAAQPCAPDGLDLEGNQESSQPECAVWKLTHRDAAVELLMATRTGRAVSNQGKVLASVQLPPFPEEGLMDPTRPQPFAFPVDCFREATAGASTPGKPAGGGGSRSGVPQPIKQAPPAAPGSGGGHSRGSDKQRSSGGKGGPSSSDRKLKVTYSGRSGSAKPQGSGSSGGRAAGGSRGKERLAGGRVEKSNFTDPTAQTIADWSDDDFEDDGRDAAASRATGRRSEGLVGRRPPVEEDEDDSDFVGDDDEDDEDYDDYG